MNQGDVGDAQGPFCHTYRERINFTILNSQSFLEAFRLSRSRVQVEHLLTDLSLGERFVTGTNKSMALTGEQRLLLSVSRMGNGGQQHATSRINGVSKSTVCRAVKEVVACLFDIAPQTICCPQQTQEIADQFYAKGRFPNWCGIANMVNIDGPLLCVVGLKRLPSIDMLTTPWTSWPSDAYASMR